MELYDKILISSFCPEAKVCRLEYFITEKSLDEMAVYGVAVKSVVKTLGHESEIIKRFDGLFFEKADATEFLELLARNTVTATGLGDIVDEYCADRQLCLK